MEKELRKHPRVPANLPCSLLFAGSDDELTAYAFSIASEGLGVQLDRRPAVSLAVGETVTIALDLEGSLANVEGRIAWIQRAPNRSCSIGVHLSRQPASAIQSYEDWVEQRFAALREDSFELGGSLAADRVISLRVLQRALDDQARDGGFLCDHLSAIELPKASSS